MKRPLAAFLPPLLSLLLLLILASCSPPTPSPYIACDVQALVDAINDANNNPDTSTINLAPGCIYTTQEPLDHSTGLPQITTEVIIEGNGATITRLPYTGEPYTRYRLFWITEDGSLTLSNVTLDGGYVHHPLVSVDHESGSGGAILNQGVLHISNGIFENNRASYGGAIANINESTLTVQNSTFSNNMGEFSSGAVYVSGNSSAQISGVRFEGNQSPGTYTYPLVYGWGGAIGNYGVTRITGSTFIENWAKRGPGAIFNYGSGELEIFQTTFTNNESDEHVSVIQNAGLSIHISNTTISGNVSTSANHGAILNESGSLTISYSTITENSGGSPTLLSGNNGVAVSNSIITNNGGGDCAPSLVFTLNGSNIDSDGTCSGFITADPLLEPLAANGGSTLTHALDPSSPAVNLASGDCPATDQRGVSRPYGNACDLGAYESEVGTSVCDVQFLVDAIHDANADPDPTTIELTPGCIYVVDQIYNTDHPFFGATPTGLPVIDTEISIIGNGATITRPAVDQQPEDYRFFFVNYDGDLSLANLTLTGGLIQQHKEGLDENSAGGAVLSFGDLSIDNVLMIDNIAWRGGGVMSTTTWATVSIYDSVFRNNTGYVGGGAVIAAGAEAQIMGSIFEDNQSPGATVVLKGSAGAVHNATEMSISNCSFIDNFGEFKGGALSNTGPRANLEIVGSVFVGNQADYGSIINNGPNAAINITNTTISGNVVGGMVSAGVFNENGILEISHSTIAFNDTLGPVIQGAGTETSISNSIIADNLGGDCDPALQLTALGSNIDSDGSCPGFITTDPLLEPLADNGGLTLTHALDPSSPAIDIATSACPAADQRGVVRPQSFFCDLGAYEAEEVETCSINYLVNAIHFANSDPDPTTIELEPGCTYVVDQQYGDRQSGLPQLTTPITILGNGATITRPGLEQQPDEYRFFYIELGTSVSISDLTLSLGVLTGAEGINDDSDSHGGAIFNRGVLSLAGITFQDNQALSGGALANDDRGGLVITDSSFLDNIASWDGGALYLAGRGGAEISGALFEGNQAKGEGAGGQGGAIYNQFDLALSSSSLNANDSTQGGGGIFNLGEADIYSCTLWRNSAAQAGGSALENQSGTLTLFNSTLSGNQAGPGNLYTVMNGGGLIRISYSTVTAAEGGAAALGGVGNRDSYRYDVINSIVANNPPGDCASGISTNVYGNNLDSDGSCQGFSHTGDPLLQPLADNGGGTWTHAIPMDSPALNAASGECPISDQRGVSRPQGSACDLGAYEYDGIQPTPPPTQEADPCLYEALVNASCRVSDYQESAFIATLAQGESALLLGINPEGTHGLFGLEDNDPCWILLSLLFGINPGDCDPPCYDPPPKPTPSLVCSADLGEEDCLKAGGIWHPGGAGAAWCECP